MKRVVTYGLVCICCYWTMAALPALADQPSLLQMVAEWQYPDAAFHGAQASDGETVDAKGDRTVPSIICKTTMTTEASVEKVLAYYQKKLSAKDDAAFNEIGLGSTSGRSVFVSDDSGERPLALHTIIVNADVSSTTLVISRGKDEAKTHIAWKHYRRLKP